MYLEYRDTETRYPEIRIYPFLDNPTPQETAFAGYYSVMADGIRKNITSNKAQSIADISKHIQAMAKAIELFSDFHVAIDTYNTLQAEQNEGGE